MKKRKVQDGELHEIENKRRSRVVRDKKKGERRLKPWTKKRKLRALLPVCLIAIFGVSIFALGSFGNVDPNLVDDGFVTVAYPLPDDASTPLDHTALENIGYMNTRFKGQKNWYSEMHGTTNAAGVNQSVNTFKQYANSALIMADITSSSLVNAARQFCYYGDEVMWRNGTSYTGSSFDEMNAIVWKTGEPYAHMNVSDFKARNGLPGTELFVYVINETTLVSATEVVDNGNGTYTQSYVLDPATDKAPAHYVNQMKFTGGLTGLPEFEYINLTCTFDDSWQILSFDVDEGYKAEMVITVNCTSIFHTDFSYNTPKAESPAFEDYFKQYLGKGITGGDLPATVDAMGCLTSAFLSKPVSLGLSCVLNGNEVNGQIYLDASKLDIAAIMRDGNINLDAALAGIELRARIGEISLYLDKGTAYISAGSLKARLSVEELIKLIERYTAPSDEANAGTADGKDAPIFAIDDPETEEPDDGFSFVAGESAVMKAKLDLSSLGIDLTIPLNFYFSLAEDNRATLSSADLSLVYGEFDVSVKLDKGETEVPSLSDAEKSEFFDLIPYANGLAELFTQENLNVEIDYRAEGFSLSGSVDLAIKGDFRASGELLLAFGEARLPVKFGFEDSVLYINIAGMKMRAGVDEIMALAGKLSPDGGVSAEGDIGLSKLIDLVLKNDLLALLDVQESDGALKIAVKGTELLKIFGIDFALGNVELRVTDGVLSASMLGASVKMTKGEAVTVDKEGYIAILPYAEELIDLFTGEAIDFSVGYEQNGLKVAGDLTLNLKNFSIVGTVTLGYREIEKSVDIYFADNTVYLAIDGLKVKASVQTILDLVAEITGESVSFEMPEIDIESLLGKVLSLDFANLLQMREENGKLCLKVDGTKLLNGLGLDFELGEINAEVGGGTVHASVLGATVAVSAGTAKVVTGLEEYADIAPLIPYVGELKDLLMSPVLKAEIDFANEIFSVNGEISIAIQGGIKVSGEIAITYGEVKIAAKLGFEDGDVYLEVAGMKLKVSADEISALLKDVLPEIGSFDLQELIDALLSEETLRNFVISEGDGILSIAVKGTELLQIFGIDFALGDVDLKVSDGALSASVLGANVKVTKGESVTVDKEGYIEILPYIEDIIDLLTGEALALNINYEQNGLKVAGNFTVKTGDYHIYGTVKFAYNGMEKLANLHFDGTHFYLAVDGLKARLDLSDVKELIQEFMGSNVPDIGAVVAKLLTADLSKLIALGKTENKLEILVRGNELLRELGIDFALGDLNLTVENGKLHLGVLGISLDAEKGVAFSSEEVWNVLGNEADFADVGELIKSIPQILNDQAISLNGSVALNVNGTQITVGIERGVLSWKGGLNVYLDLRLNVNGIAQRVELAIDTTEIRLAYGQIGVELAFSELSDLETALMELYRQVRETADKILVSENPMPEEVDGLLDLLETVIAVPLPDFRNLKIETFLKELVLGAPKSKDGICTVAWEGITLELLNTNDKRFAGVAIRFENESVSVGGTLNANSYKGELPVLPELDYLDKAAFENLIDFLGAAVATLAETNLQVTVTGEVLSADTQKYPDGKKYDIKGEINYYAGVATPIRLDLDGKKLWVNSDVYLYASFALVAKAEGDQGLDLQLFLLDSDGDGVLDVYASVSLLGRDSAAYTPLNLYARADELMPVLASALAVLGIDNAIITDYVLAPWLDVTTTAQLKALGDGLKPLILGLFGGAAEETASRQAEEEFRSFISSVKIGEDSITVNLPSDVLFGVQGDDLSVTIGKVNGENGARLSFVSVANIYSNNGAENTSLRVGIETKSDVERPQPAFDNLVKIEGVSSLLKTLAKSTTHEGEVISGEEEKHSYAINKNFYIEGDIAIDLNLVGLIKLNVNIRLVAISITIDENGDVGVNVRFEYDGIEKVGVTVINGNSVIDITGKNGMVYIKRVQTTDASQKPLAQPITLYRSMPLSNFVSDMLAQMGFVFNFGKTVTDILNSIDMSGSSNGSEDAEDIGTLFHRYLKSLNYTAGETDSWTAVLNGSALLDGLQDVSVTLGADRDGLLRDLSVNTGLSMTGLSMNIKANMRYKNPCGIMDGDVEKDVTTDVEGILRHGMGHKLDTVDWSAVKYLEGEYTSVKYVLAGEVLKTQYVVVSTGAEGNDPAGTLYGKLEYPTIPSEYELAGYKIEWKTAIDVLPANRTVEAVYVPLTYRLIFASDRETDGYTFDEELGLWVIRAEYRYGEAFALPFAETPAERIAYFTDGAGNRYTSIDDWSMENTVFTAVWEKKVYTVTFDIGGEKTVLTGHYGDEIDFPEAEERVGYNFVGWTVDGEFVNRLTLTQDVTLKAQYEPVTVCVTLVSDEAVDGFTAQNGKYIKTVFVTYGMGAAELPTEIKSGSMLVAFKDVAGNHYYRVENLTQDITLYAVWEEVDYTVTFLAEDGSVVKTINAKSGEQISTRADVPAVPDKKGYTGAWSFGSDTVTENMTVSAVYAANEYTVTVISGLPYAGFAETANGYQKQFRYTYDGAEVNLDALGDIPGYWFKGYYSQENGKGELLTSVSGITEDITIYIWWQDNTVSVRLYSDLKYEGSIFDPQKNGYYVVADFNDDYALNYAPVIEGYQQLGWWYNENGAWEPVSNVERFHGQASVAIWAVWIQNIDVVISDFSVNKTNIGITSTITYNIMGSFTGGSVVVGKSTEIFQKAPERSVQFVIYRENKRDGLSGGDEIVIEGNTFRKLKMTSGNAGSSWNTAPYGGARITHTFTYTDANGNMIPVSTQDEYCISLETYRYEFCNEAGEVCNTVDIRGVYGEEVRLGGFLPAVPEKEGYTGSWSVDSATVVDSGNRGTVETSGVNDIVTLYTKRIVPVYSVNRYQVRLESAKAIDGWTQEGNKYVYECEAEYGSSVIFYRDNKILASYAVGVKNNVFTLPVLDQDYIWSSAEITKSAIKCYAQRNVDTALYVSEVTFEYDGVSYDSYSEEIGDDYHLIVPERAGFTFLGWYENSSGSWAKVTSLQAANGAVGVTYKLHALWLSDLTVTDFTAKRSGLIGDRKYSGSVSVSGGELIGAFAKEEGVTVNTEYTFFVNDSAGATTENDRDYTIVHTVEREYASTYQFSDVKKTKKNYMHVAVQMTYSYGGETFTTDEKTQSYAF